MVADKSSCKGRPGPQKQNLELEADCGDQSGSTEIYVFLERSPETRKVPARSANTGITITRRPTPMLKITSSSASPKPATARATDSAPRLESKTNASLREVKIDASNSKRSELSEEAQAFQHFVDSGLYADFGGGLDTAGTTQAYSGDTPFVGASGQDMDPAVLEFFKRY